MKKILETTKLFFNECSQDAEDNHNTIFPLRPLWVLCDNFVAISDSVGIPIPTFFLDNNKKKIEFFCQRIIQLGFNALILGKEGDCFGEKPNIHFTELAAISEIFAELGLKLILKPSIYVNDQNLPLSPFSPKLAALIRLSIEALLKKVPRLDYLFWTSFYGNSDFQLHPIGRNKTKEEKVLNEIKILEGCLQKTTKLIYYLPCKDKKTAEEQSKWILNVMRETAANTILAFSSVAGSPYDDHLEIHPFFEKINSCSKLSATPLLPIMNAGGVDQGNGLWPNIHFEFTQKYFSYIEKDEFVGIVHMTSTMPRQKSFLDCALWTSSQLMRKNTQIDLSLKTWFKSSYPEIDLEKHIVILKKARKLILDLSEMRAFMHMDNSKDQAIQDLMRFQGYRSLAECREIECLLKIEQNKAGIHTSIKDYYRYFLRDVNNLIKKILLSFDISPPNNLEGEDKGNGFWVNADMKISNKLLEKPNIGDPGTPTHKLYQESNLEVE